MVKKHKNKKYEYLVGIDEVGRGALAGPVAVTALAAPKDLRFKIKDLRLPLRDSKKLSPKQREIWFKFIKNHPQIFYATAFVSYKIIDKINISRAANLAVGNAFKRLIKNSELSLPRRKPAFLRGIKSCAIFLDGGLRLSFIQNSKFKIHNSIVKGDEKIPVISLASIVAKVSRDRLMKKEHKKYPRYDFIHNVGYGVKKHAIAIKKYGRSPIHRRSFKTPIA